jgi:hypothetical protein
MDNAMWAEFDNRLLVHRVRDHALQVRPQLIRLRDPHVALARHIRAQLRPKSLSD